MSKLNNHYTLIIHYLKSESESVRVIGPFKSPQLCVNEAVDHWGAIRPDITRAGNACVFGRVYSVHLNTDHVVGWEVGAVEFPRGPHGWE